MTDSNSRCLATGTVARTVPGSEAGTGLGGGLLWYFTDEMFVSRQRLVMNLDNLKDHAAFSQRSFTQPLPERQPEIFSTVEQDYTVEAVRRRIIWRTGKTIETNTRFLDTWVP